MIKKVKSKYNIDWFKETGCYRKHRNLFVSIYENSYKFIINPIKFIKKNFIVMTIILLYIILYMSPFILKQIKLNTLNGFDYLSYYSVITTSLVSFIGIYWTLRNNRKLMYEQIEIEKSLNVRPYFTICSNSDSELKEIEAFHKDFFIVNDKENFICDDMAQIQLLKENGLFFNHKKNTASFLLRNSGMGIALNIELRIYFSSENSIGLTNSIGDIRFYSIDSQTKYLYFKSKAVGDEIYINLVNNFRKSESEKFYIGISYHNIYNLVQKRQFFEINFDFNANTFSYFENDKVDEAQFYI